MDHKHDDDVDDDNDNIASDIAPHFTNPQQQHAMVALLKGQKYIINCSVDGKFNFFILIFFFFYLFYTIILMIGILLCTTV